MLGTSLAWFFYDFVVSSTFLGRAIVVPGRLLLTSSFSSQTYPFGIFSDTIIGDLNPYNTVVQNIGYGTVVNCFYLPGCLLGGFLMDKIGRKQTMTLGFALWSIMGFIIEGALGPASRASCLCSSYFTASSTRWVRWALV